MSNNLRDIFDRLSDEEFMKMMNGYNANYIDIRDTDTLLDFKKDLEYLQRIKKGTIPD